VDSTILRRFGTFIINGKASQSEHSVTYNHCCQHEIASHLTQNHVT